MTDTRRRNFIIILILGALDTISPFAIDMYLPAFPQIAADLGTTPARVSLSLSSYFIGMAAGQLIYGPLLDRFGRRIPTYIGLACFIVACLGCMLSQTVEGLIFFRFVQALTGCVAMVAAMAMVRDFFPPADSARVLSMLMLVISVSPMLAPTVGSLVAIHLGWKWVFVILSVFVAVMMVVMRLFLPQGQMPDRSVSLHPAALFKTYMGVMAEPVFYTYALSGALSFSALLVYVAGSPVIFLEEMQVGPRLYGMIFAFLATGFIGSNQVNIWLLKKYTSAQIYFWALVVQCAIGFVFVAAAVMGLLGLGAMVGFMFIYLACAGLAYPNAAGLALGPFEKNAGSASALLNFLQIGLGSLASAFIGLLDAKGIVPIVAMLASAGVFGMAMLLVGRRKIA
jgi:MFS transporter, DHA1 family, multidrug resistance protein